MANRDMFIGFSVGCVLVGCFLSANQMLNLVALERDIRKLSPAATQKSIAQTGEEAIAQIKDPAGFQRYVCSKLESNTDGMALGSITKSIDWEVKATDQAKTQAALTLLDRCVSAVKTDRTAAISGNSGPIKSLVPEVGGREPTEEEIAIGRARSGLK